VTISSRTSGRGGMLALQGKHVEANHTDTRGAVIRRRESLRRRPHRQVTWRPGADAAEGARVMLSSRRGLSTGGRATSGTRALAAFADPGLRLGHAFGVYSSATLELNSRTASDKPQVAPERHRRRSAPSSRGTVNAIPAYSSAAAARLNRASTRKLAVARRLSSALSLST